MTQLSAGLKVFGGGDNILKEEASIIDSIKSFKQTLYLFKTSLQEVADFTMSKMKEAADEKNVRSEQLIEGLKNSILVFACQIPILFGFIFFNRVNACFCLTNLVWFSTGLVCVGLIYNTY
jgi:hypothetical protein